MSQKVTVVGAGKVGAAAAEKLAEADFEVVLIDARQIRAKNATRDIVNSIATTGRQPHVTGTNSWGATAGSSAVVVAVSMREWDDRNLLGAHAEIVHQIGGAIKVSSPAAKVVVATRPVAAMCHAMLAGTGFPPERVVGLTSLDSTLFEVAIREHVGWQAAVADALVLGGGGEKLVPLVSRCLIGGRRMSKALVWDEIQEVVEATRASAFGLSSAYAGHLTRFGPAAAILGQVLAPGVYLGLPVLITEDGAFADGSGHKLAHDEVKGLKQVSSEVARQIDSIGLSPIEF
jgi:malate dehydrogenase